MYQKIERQFLEKYIEIIEVYVLKESSPTLISEPDPI